MIENQRELELTRKDGLIAMLFASPIMLLFSCLGDWKRGLGAWICAGLLFLVVKMHWDLRHQSWFWMTVVILGGLQVPFVLYIPWSNMNLSYASLLPIGVLDFAIMYGCIRLAEKVASRKRSSI